MFLEPDGIILNHVHYRLRVVLGRIPVNTPPLVFFDHEALVGIFSISYEV